MPFALRAKGYTVFSFAVTASLVFNQYINPIALKAIAWKYYVRISLTYFSIILGSDSDWVSGLDCVLCMDCFRVCVRLHFPR